jgi:DNA-binding NtrC family response regulator
VGSVLIVDDDESFATAASRIVHELGHVAQTAVDGQDGLAKFHDGDYDVVIADLKMPRMSGQEFIREIRRIDHDAVVMVITGFADISTAVETLTLGAYDYVEKPVELEKFRAALERGMEKRRLLSKLRFAKGAIWTIAFSIPLWLVLGIILALFWKK